MIRIFNHRWTPINTDNTAFIIFIISVFQKNENISVHQWLKHLLQLFIRVHSRFPLMFNTCGLLFYVFLEIAIQDATVNSMSLTGGKVLFQGLTVLERLAEAPGPMSATALARSMDRHGFQSQLAVDSQFFL